MWTLIQASELILSKTFYDCVGANIEKMMTKLYEKSANKGHKKMLFEQRYLVWVHLRKNLFPVQCKSKLYPRADGPFKVSRKINDNAYEIDLPSTYGVSTSFNIAGLSPFFGLEDSKTTKREDDVDMSPLAQVIFTQIYKRPITHNRAKLLQQELHYFLFELHPNIDENNILL